MSITPVILCGGSGTRLWPLSRQSFPKQFVPLVGTQSLLQLTLARLAWCGNPPMCVASEDHRFLVADAMESQGAAGQVLLEPAARNTAAAMALAALLAASPADADPLLLFCPSDHHIPDIEAFAHTIRQGVPAAEAGAIVTFGVVPSFPSTAYGYIEQGDARADGSRRVARFIEKPAPAAAQALLLQGNVLWNAGIFLVRASTLLTALGQHADDILQSCRQAMAHPKQDTVGQIDFVRPEAAPFLACRSQSIDYAVMERHADVAVVPFQGQWSDVGSWNAVADLSPADDDGNRITGQGHTLHASNTFIHAPHRTVVALGTKDLLIIDTPDALLVAQRDHAEQVKDVVAHLARLQVPQAAMHRRVARPWGWYDSVDMGERFQVKRIGVKPGASLSLQKHHHRAEHWIVVKGTAEVTRGSETYLLSENQSTYIPIGEVHRLHNPGKLALEMIEVQSGSYLGEDDIVRLEDKYGRQPDATKP
ncbi:MAG: mannose-1-phosphate guanylyltransferase/mannose-6-phosphate isomerase [Hydrogenophaga sp.]|uniref:mannose-1-phosphate guanylyltransferase/mannose-6-phosphate isomerase n=1 Tax=Hydrogenophaga sp. TaxID=1904254 RepID=UPI002722C920|nr:mannose-1-phosphate guanylyltransferase/mannose-6-phosphate isomerase [Hydrogenophaga sp.]MDO9506231.1 mannose-1-phosphate guanylyltransferase/mannose-6-phosphate isomerase [Hydrogenophaga sp.]MDP3625952.1 mannose-1-phosphate guanylyltransferase/mannose-6-phosphate isomerase [Hydrogenophaga sp.]